jgi:Uma2 family endonuclease
VRYQRSDRPSASRCGFVDRCGADPSALAIEIVSLGSRDTDRVMKAYEYAQAGIEHYWIVDLDADPDDRFLANVLREGTYQRVEALAGDRVRTEVPLALGFSLEKLTQP